MHATLARLTDLGTLARTACCCCCWCAGAFCTDAFVVGVAAEVRTTSGRLAYFWVRVSLKLSWGAGLLLCTQTIYQQTWVILPPAWRSRRQPNGQLPNELMPAANAPALHAALFLWLFVVRSHRCCSPCTMLLKAKPPLTLRAPTWL